MWSQKPGGLPSLLHLYGLGLLFSSPILCSSGFIISGLGVLFPSAGLGGSPRKSAFRAHESCTRPGRPLSFQMLFSAGFPSSSVASTGVCSSQVFQMLRCCFLSFFSHRLQNHEGVGVICGFPPPTSVLGFEGMSCHQFCYKHALLLRRIQIKKRAAAATISP